MKTTEKRNAIIGAVVLGFIIIGLTLWYMASNPPMQVSLGEYPAAPVPPGAYEKEILTDESRYHTAVAAYPSDIPLRESAGPEANAMVVARLNDFATSQIADFKARAGFETMTEEDISMLGFDQGRKYALELDFDVSESPKTLTYVYTIYEDTLGAHPNGTYRTFTFDKATGKELGLSDIFTGDYLSRLSAISRQVLPGNISALSGVEADLEYIETGTTPTAENFQWFALQNDMLILLFPPYQVGPYALGPQFVEIPLSEITDILNPTYQP
ncbi:MAG TPA: RsiV family protein [Candidatus Paceibacterota bacterium]|nr:RsiV family protein [Candidatus Paceibacterota bacterium]